MRQKSGPAAGGRRDQSHPARDASTLSAEDKIRIVLEGRNHPLKTAGMTGYVCTPGASLAGIPSRRA
jgi:hypothetical protein